MKTTKGLSLIELLITMAVVGVVMGIGALNLKPLNNDAGSAAGQLVGFLKLTRAKAMSTTSAYRVWTEAGSKPGQLRLYAERAKRCSDGTWTRDPKLQVELPEKVTLDLDFSLWNFRKPCFDSRGLSSDYAVVILKDDRSRIRKVELLLGGAARVVQ